MFEEVIQNVPEPKNIPSEKLLEVTQEAEQPVDKAEVPANISQVDAIDSDREVEAIVESNG